MDMPKSLQDLLEKSKEDGFVSIEEVAKHFNIESEDFEDIRTTFEDNGVFILTPEEIEEKKEEEEDKKEDDIDDVDFPGAISDEDLNLESFEEIMASINNSSIKTDDPVKMYLKDIGNFELLSTEEETRLAIVVANGREALEKIDQFENCEIDLTDEEEAKYRRLANSAIQAKDKLVNYNLRLVVSIAKKYTGKGMQFLDLIQEGNMGLMKAVDKFDPDKGFKFSTYATWWVRQAITRAVADQARTIRIPVHMVETINKLARVQRQLVQQLSREPKPEELAEKMGITVEKVQMIQKIAQEPISLESPVGEEDDSLLGDFVSDPNGINPYEYTSNEMLKKEVEEALSTLNEREQEVLKLRFGLVDGKCHTLEDVGKKFNVTRERIRQIEAKALRKLRHPSRSKKLKGFIGKDDGNDD